MKSSRRLRLMLLGLLLLLAAVAGVNWITDPYGAWRVAIVDRVYTRDKIELTRVITPYRLRTKEPITLLIGASRVLLGMPIEQGYRDGVLNASLMGGTLDEIAPIAQVAIQKPKLHRLILEVEFFTFDKKWIGIRDPRMPRRLEGDTPLRVVETLLTTEVLDERRKLFLRAGLSRTVPEHAIAQWVDIYSNYRVSARQIALFRDTITQIRQAGIDAIVFVPPLGEYELETIRQSGHWEAFQQ